LAAIHTDTASPEITLVRRKALAKALGVSEVTLWRLRDELPRAVEISKGVRAWRQSDISAWLETRTAR
jgi:predicted DNA-binding transcriptional regulator AlpA